LVRLTGLYRQNATAKADYSIGGSVELPLVQSQRWNLVFQSDARKTERDFATFVGVRAFFNRRNSSIAASGGYNRRGNGKDRVTGELQGALQSENSSGSEFLADAAVGRDFEASYVRAGVRMQGSQVNLRSEFLQRFGDEGETQYAASIDGGIAIAEGHLGFAGRDVSDAAISVTAPGASDGQKFDVLVNDGPRATVSANKTAVVFLQAFESYKVRLRPVGEGLSSFDPSEKDVALHPGRVVDLSWTIAPTFVMFGRAVAPEGIPLPNADVSGDHGVGRTDALGFFQVAVRTGDALRVTTTSGAQCLLSAYAGAPIDSFLAAGDLTCK
jgi:hypothetical protein